MKFTLSPEGVLRVYEILTCLAKFSETVGLDANKEQVILSALNSSRTTAASFTLEGKTFFNSYCFDARYNDRQRPSVVSDRFSCEILNKAIISIFKGRVNDRENDASIERCEVLLQDGEDQIESLILIKLICKHGVKKTYKLTFEPAEPIHAVFDRSSAMNKWTIGAYALKTYSEYFGARTENLDITYNDGRVSFTSYTEMVVNGAEILKHPLRTSVTVDTFDFESFSVEEGNRIVISVKDFKAINNHAETLRASVAALYSYPGQPLLLTYSNHGMCCEFTLMTMGAYRISSATPGSLPNRQTSTRLPMKRSLAEVDGQSTRIVSASNSARGLFQEASTSFGQRFVSQNLSRPHPTPLRTSVNEESLFIPDDEDDEERLWGERQYDEDEGNLRWDSAGTSFQRQSITQPLAPGSRRIISRNSHDLDDKDENGGNEYRIAPTQRMSQVHGIFDE